MKNSNQYNRAYLAGRAIAKMKGIEINPKWPTWDHSLHLECLRSALDGEWDYCLIDNVTRTLHDGFSHKVDINDLSEAVYADAELYLEKSEAMAFVDGILEESVHIKDYINGIPD